MREDYLDLMERLAQKARQEIKDRWARKDQREQTVMLEDLVLLVYKD